MSFGPADLYVVEFSDAAPPDEVTAELRDVTTAGVITLLDLALVRGGVDGAAAVVELDDLSDEFGLAGVRPLVPGLIGDDDLRQLGAGLGRGELALVVLLENTWARRLARAARDGETRVRQVERFSAEVVNEVAGLAGVPV
ncbi:MAG: hypothetical protein J0I14_11980 [Propionibacteriaceae bacterium]|jgi:hypothetical protein|nr:hypothetical protein [Propionibacteriaceae bacterium]